MNIHHHRVGADHYLYTGCFQREQIVTCFDPVWQAAHATTQQVDGGRAAVRVLELDGVNLLLRRYHRGGLVRHVSTRSYLWTPLSATRASRELRLLDQMHGLGLPCPRPCACHIRYSGLVYQAEILIHHIPACITLAACLARQALSPGIWQAIGRCIRSFHDAGINHADLNASNLLLQWHDPEAPLALQNLRQIWLIDFDRASTASPGGRWCAANLARLRRSLEKYQSGSLQFYWDTAAGKELLSGYGSW